ncbi:hypothetical protein [Aquibacillus rhizosphaerae]|uniref:Uncharacterized protein n=1 Tax=Aquibacillus rhizosphaerae TaxID=3051431 RepID=A0ABT7LAC7_9BACI|nr:hypothetical protein [Aquibacillus sp. LR5S19]MDL4842808.1 hypothetical protein [Aquibacillus sp. LR5S19]
MKVPIPYCYVWMSATSVKRGQVFRKYVAGYVRNNYPGCELVKIEGMTAICERRENTHQGGESIG